MNSTVRPDIVVTDAKSLEAVYHDLIPISRAMGLTVVDYDGTTLRLAAPLEPNVNHQRSGFGGSLYAVAALAGWGILQLKFNELGVNCSTVIGKGEVEYVRPVFSDFECVTALPDEYEQFASQLVESGRAKLILTATIMADGKPAMTLTGQYFVNLKT